VQPSPAHVPAVWEGCRWAASHLLPRAGTGAHHHLLLLAHEGQAGACLEVPTGAVGLLQLVLCWGRAGAGGTPALEGTGGAGRAGAAPRWHQRRSWWRGVARAALFHLS
jgi:hypothetical protein